MSVARLSCMLVDKIGFLMKERVYACIGGANGRVGLGSTGVGAVWRENRLASDVSFGLRKFLSLDTLFLQKALEWIPEK